jgi:hypothetical protein
MEGLTREQLGRYLDRVAHLYPGGLPRMAVVAPEAEAAPEPNFEVGYVVPSPQQPLPDSLLALLEGITTKGLSLDVSRTVIKVCAVADLQELALAITHVATVDVARVIIVLGGGGELAGTWQAHGSVPVLYTRSLGEIEADKLVKREFWGHLQGVLTKLGRR